MSTFDPSLCSLDQAKTACRVDGDSQDDLLRRLILRATGYAEKVIRPNLKSRIYSDTDVAAAAPSLVVDGNDERFLDLPYDPVTAVAKVEYLSAMSPDVWTTVDPTLYPCLIDARVPGRIFFRSYRLPWGHQNVKVSFTAGFVTIPEDISGAVADIVAHRYKQPDRQTAGVASRSFEGQTTTYLNEEVPKAALADLLGYARIAV